MPQEQFACTLPQEGFSNTYVWQDRPIPFYPDHKHATDTAHIALQGEMTLTLAGASRTYRAGAAMYLPERYIARMGPGACRYRIGSFAPLFSTAMSWTSLPRGLRVSV